MSQQVGLIGEQQAKNFLIHKGLRFLTNNYRCRWGEVDLILADKDHLVFVEVRARISANFGGALESITVQKRKKIIKTASHYMTVKKLFHSHSARFDVICIQGASAEIEWIPNAFGMDY